MCIPASWKVGWLFLVPLVVVAIVEAFFLPLQVEVYQYITTNSYRSTSVTSCYKHQEMEKKRKYEERINTVEHASFTPIILACTGGCSKITTTFIKRLSSLISQKRNLPYSKTVNWVRCRLGFALLRACIMSLRGSRVKYHHHPTSDYNILLANAEGRLT